MDKEFENAYHRYENHHFWFRGRRDAILRLTKKYPRDISILDIGCSSGLLLESMQKVGFEKANLYGIDISSEAIYNCREKGLLNCTLDNAERPVTLQQKFDLIIASDCLEHLENDEDSLKKWSGLLKEKGTLIVFVPAYEFLWSRHDEVNFHFRRYTKSLLKKLIKKTDLRLVKCSYWNTILFLPIAVFRILSKFFEPSKTDNNGNIFNLPILNSFFYNILKAENKIINHFDFPFGVSVFCVAEKS